MPENHGESLNHKKYYFYAAFCEVIYVPLFVVPATLRVYDYFYGTTCGLPTNT